MSTATAVPTAAAGPVLIVGASLAGATVAAAPDLPAAPYFWSDQYDKTLQYSGEHTADSRLVLRGDPNQPEPLSGFFLSDKTLTAVLGVNDGRQFRRAQRLLGLTPDPADLINPTVDLRHLPSTPVLIP